MYRVVGPRSHQMQEADRERYGTARSEGGLGYKYSGADSRQGVFDPGVSLSRGVYTRVVLTARCQAKHSWLETCYGWATGYQRAAEQAARGWLMARERSGNPQSTSLSETLMTGWPARQIVLG